MGHQKSTKFETLVETAGFLLFTRAKSAGYSRYPAFSTRISNFVDLCWPIQYPVYYPVAVWTGLKESFAFTQYIYKLACAAYNDISSGAPYKSTYIWGNMAAAGGCGCADIRGAGFTGRGRPETSRAAAAPPRPLPRAGARRPARQNRYIHTRMPNRV